MSNYLPEFVKLAKKLGMTPEKLMASLSEGKETINTVGNTVPATPKAAEKLASSATATTATATATMSPEDLVIKTLRALVKDGTYEVRQPVLGADGKQVILNGKKQWSYTGEKRPLPKGLNAKIDLNPVLRDAFGNDFDCKGLTEQMAKDGKIVIRPIKGSVMVYLPGNVRQSTRVSRLAEVLAYKG